MTRGVVATLLPASWLLLAASVGACRATIPDATYVCSATAECPPGFACDPLDGLCVRAANCVPRTCDELRAQCGTVDDGCGTPIECGECTAPEECGGGGLDNLCGCAPSACTPRQCGIVDNGCGALQDCGGCDAPAACVDGMCACPGSTCEAGECGMKIGACGDGPATTIDCGACPSGQTCGADSPNVCGVGTCTPATCAGLGYTCGTFVDGCGGAALLECGSCTAPETCGGGGPTGRIGQCGCTPRTCASTATRPSACGDVREECGQTLDCGACMAHPGTHCTANRCVCNRDAREDSDTVDTPWSSGPLSTQTIDTANIDVTGDDDWYVFDSPSDLSRSLSVTLSNIPAGADYDLGVYFRCSDVETFTCGGGIPGMVSSPYPGCERATPSNATETISISRLPCTNAKVYIRVIATRAVDPVGACTNYVLSISVS